jgi:hypothetical protein
MKLLFRIDWLLAASGCAYMKPQGMTNVECRLKNGGIASLSLFIIDRIHYFDIRHLLFDIYPPPEDSLFQSRVGLDSAELVAG